jgi:predicted transcriptional regulator of viral defense system
MAKSKRVTKMLTVSQMNLLKQLDDEEISLFTIDTVKEFASDTDNLNEIIENLVRKGFLHRLERGKYCRSTFRDEHVIGTYFVPGSAIAYWSALNLYGLTEQFPNTIFVQTTHKKNPVSFMGTDYQFIKINPQKKSGIVYNGYGNYKYPITDLEKTMVDCFDLPQYSGGYAELIRAFHHAKLNAEKLINYCITVNNIAVTKRMGFLSELFHRKELLPFTEFARSKINRTYNLFDPFGENTGKTETAWYLRLNLSKESILEIAENSY